MPSGWFFQANPQQYDIDAALENLNRIQWRTPQHASEVSVDDRVLIWRSGNEAGVIAVGVVVAPPAQRAPSPEESAYSLTPQESSFETRTPIFLRKTRFIPKEEIAQIPTLGGHQILVAPMGTVFPIDQAALQELEELAGPFPNAMPDPSTDFVPVLGWGQRRKGVHPLPGRVDGYLSTLRSLLEHARSVKPERAELIRWMMHTYSVTETRARFVVDFLRKVSLLSGQESKIQPTTSALLWLDGGDDGFLVSLLHSRIQLFGELLDVLRDPRTTQEVLDVANTGYAMGWSTAGQVNHRLNWLRSAGLVEYDDEGRLVVTEDGKRMHGLLDLHPALAGPTSPQVVPPEPVEILPAGGESAHEVDEVAKLTERLIASANNASQPDEFEVAVADAFRFLGFDSEWLGGSGKTDVLVVAALGGEEDYRVILDGKTTGGAAISDQQIDWTTLREHKEQHNADHVALVGPAFKGGRLFRRAKENQVALIPASVLASLCRQHTVAPLDLVGYRELFKASGDESSTDTPQILTEAGDEVRRWINLATTIVQTISALEGSEGALTEEALYWNLRDFPEDLGAPTREEITEVVRALSSPALGVLRRSEGGYKSPGSLKIASRRLRLIADLLEGTSR